MFSKLTNQKESSSYTELTSADLSNPSTADYTISFIKVEGNDSVVEAKERIQNNEIVVLDISFIESNNISMNTLTRDIKKTIADVQGEAIHKQRNDIIICTPGEIDIQKT